MLLLGTACRDDLPCHDLRYLGTAQILGHLAGSCFPLVHPPQIVFMQFIHVSLLYNLLRPMLAPIAKSAVKVIAQVPNRKNHLKIKSVDVVYNGTNQKSKQTSANGGGQGA